MGQSEGYIFSLCLIQRIGSNKCNREREKKNEKTKRKIREEWEGKGQFTIDTNVPSFPRSANQIRPRLSAP